VWASMLWGAALFTNSAMGTCSAPVVASVAGVLLPQLQGAYHDP
jgi:hypothetical protein